MAVSYYTGLINYVTLVFKFHQVIHILLFSLQQNHFTVHGLIKKDQAASKRSQLNQFNIVTVSTFWSRSLSST
jgi:hypothetical protein